MALHLHRHGALDALLADLASLPPPRDPFTPARVVTALPGPAAALRGAIAVHQGIAAHLETPALGPFLDGLLRTFEGHTGPTAPDPWHPRALVWPLVDALTAERSADGTPTPADAPTLAHARRLADALGRALLRVPERLADPTLEQTRPAALPARHVRLWRRVAGTLAALHPDALLVDRRLGAIVLGAPTPGPGEWLEALYLRPTATSPLEAWLVYSGGPRLELQPDPDEAWFARALGTESDRERRWGGRPSGGMNRVTCPPGAAVTAAGPAISEGLVAGLTLVCARLPDTVDGAAAGTSATLDTPLRLGPGVAASPPAALMDCPDSGPLTGLRGRGGALVDAVGPLCDARPARGSLRRFESLRRTGPMEGGAGGSEFDLPCPSGEVMTGVWWTQDRWIEALSPVCAARLALTAP
jgi:hypothetical protein